MSDEAEFRIKIVTDADTKGFTAASDAAKSLHIETSDLNDETKRQLGLIPPLEKETKNLADTGDSATKSMLGMRQVSQELNRIIPGLGHALHAAFIGPLGPIIMAGMAIASVKKHLDDYNASLDQIGEDALAGHIENIAAVQKAWDDVKISLGKYYADLGQHGGKDPIATELKNEKELTDAKLKGLDAAKAAAEITLLTREKLERQRQAELNPVEDTSAAAGGANATWEMQQARLKRARDAQKPDSFENKAINDADDALARATSSASKALLTKADYDAGIAKAQKQLDDATKILTHEREIAAQLEASETARAKAREEALNADKAARENADRLAALAGIIAQAQALFGVKTGAPSIAGGIGDKVGRVIGADTSFAAGHGMTANESAAVVAFQQYMLKQDQNWKQILEIIMAGVKSHDTNAAIIAQVQAQVVTFATQR